MNGSLNCLHGKYCYFFTMDCKLARQCTTCGYITSHPLGLLQHEEKATLYRVLSVLQSLEDQLPQGDVILKGEQYLQSGSK